MAKRVKRGSPGDNVGESARENREVDEDLADIDPVELEEADPSLAAEPPADWDEPAHDEGEEDAWGGVESTETGELERVRGATPSINGFRVGPAKRIGVRTYRVPGTSVFLPVRREIAPLLIGFARDFHRRVERLRKGWCWGYAYRNIRGSKRPSFHAAGIAIDLNAPKHPLGRSGTFNRAQRATINALCKKYGLRWGGNYRRRKDEMHFEVILPRAKAVALAKRISSARRRSG